ncbi:Clp protease N-terminal domain-containing protein [Sphaerisporangium sp. B11E5]|uniref:Clp protease N-terminal domain-containing protein n=1 Tax=Sphaerisporangium sp. B11E5 TaxID=3153563 RepID=UPI00325DD633
MATRERSPFVTVTKAALDEARRHGGRRLGTEHLLLGLLRVPGTPAARALGVGVDEARAAMEALDRAALRAIGVDVGEFPPPGAVSRPHPPLTVAAATSTARAVLDRAVRATTRKTRATAPEHLLAALLSCEPPDPVAGLLAELGVDRAAVRSRLGLGT